MMKISFKWRRDTNDRVKGGISIRLFTVIGLYFWVNGTLIEWEINDKNYYWERGDYGWRW